MADITQASHPGICEMIHEWRTFLAAQDGEIPPTALLLIRVPQEHEGKLEKAEKSLLNLLKTNPSDFKKFCVGEPLIERLVREDSGLDDANTLLEAFITADNWGIS